MTLLVLLFYDGKKESVYQDIYIINICIINVYINLPGNAGHLLVPNNFEKLGNIRKKLNFFL